MEDLIKALQIFMKYLKNNNANSPTNCVHDTLYIMDVDPEKVTEEDKVTLEELGFEVDEDEGVFYSFRFGSA